MQQSPSLAKPQKRERAAALDQWGHEFEHLCCVPPITAMVPAWATFPSWSTWFCRSSCSCGSACDGGIRQIHLPELPLHPHKQPVPPPHYLCDHTYTALMEGYHSAFPLLICLHSALCKPEPHCWALHSCHCLVLGYRFGRQLVGPCNAPFQHDYRA